MNTNLSSEKPYYEEKHNRKAFQKSLISQFYAVFEKFTLIKYSHNFCVLILSLQRLFSFVKINYRKISAKKLTKGIAF